ncbi:YL1 nuclear protein-domain-containing protein [Lentinula raphanica]|nr:YL1 nuclear protein-domain-containing protein [Lentinula raphanica]
MEEETLVSRRSKRSTAGNRMQAALAEISVEDLSKEDAEDDQDFVVETYEEDAFESDFQSTDEEAVVEQEPLENEEKQARKAAKSRLERATAAAHARQKNTFNPTTTTTTTEGANTVRSDEKPKSKRKRRVSLGFTINAETGEIIAEPDVEDKDGHDTESDAEERNGPGPSSIPRTRKRSSKRQTTIQNTTDTVKRYLKSEQQKALNPSRRRSGTNKKRPTQAELIARALDTEEGNLVDHRDYLKHEEEKRQMRNRRDQVMVSGPLLRWISKAEEVEVEVDIEAVEDAKGMEKEKELEDSSSSLGASSMAKHGYNPYMHTLQSHAYGPGYGLHVENLHDQSSGTPAASSSLPVPSSSASSSIPSASTSATSPFLTLAPYSFPNTYTPLPSLSGYRLPSTPIPPLTPTLTPTSAPPPPPPSVSAPTFISGSGPLPITSSASPNEPERQRKTQHKIEKVSKSYLIHELSNSHWDDHNTHTNRDTLSLKLKPNWDQTMDAMFGDHVKWRELKVYSSMRNRPLARYVPTCPFTGLPAKYLDPRTGVPFADVRAYRILKRLEAEVLPHDDGDGDENDSSDRGFPSIPTTADDVDDPDLEGHEGIGVWDEDLGCYIGDWESTGTVSRGVVGS